MALPHVGSWGTWDFGVTEGIQSLLSPITGGDPRTAQGGSNLMPGGAPTTQLVSQPTSTNTSNKVLGASTNSSQLNYTPSAGGVPAPTQNNPQPQQQQAPLSDRQRFEQFMGSGGYAGWDGNAAWADWQATGGSKANQSSGPDYSALRGEISSGWDNYINSLNSQLEGLGGQRGAQEQIAESQYNQGLNQLGLQKQQGIDQLGSERQRVEKNQVKTLRDISSNLKNSFMAGNVYLGARGAGDSSAANQYSLALTKLGSQQRGDVMSQSADQMQEIGQRETNLNNIYNSEVNNLTEQKNQAMGQIAQWFAGAQNQIRQAQAQGQLGKSQDLANVSKEILNQAISQMNTLNQQFTERQNALQSWAMGVSKNIGELKQNMSQVSQFSAQLPGSSPIVGVPQVGSNGNMYVPSGYGSSEEKRRLLGF